MHNGIGTQVTIAAMGILAATGIIGTIAMYGEVQSIAAQVAADKTRIDDQERRIAQCERRYDPSSLVATKPPAPPT